ncbi:MAG TPA: nitrophenyl compound nitroreductase subunit ArsF family protein [Prolixibacteraceae bacterium]|nr:nitrophenyl compound nitroreductase subunit ArsF family protein [Prolixibacteraceae bacterium]
MKRLFTLLIVVFIISINTLSAQCCKGSTKTTALAENVTEVGQDNEMQDIKAYYFHFTRRCATCKAVEQVTIDALKKFYGKSIVLESVNLDDDANNELAEKIGIDGQTLLLVKGDEKIDITSEGFLYARTKPEKLEEIIKEEVNSLKE